LEEEDTVFTAAKHEQDIAESPSAVTVITREQIENTHCTDLVCLLRQVPGVDVRRTLPAFAVVGARAMTEDFGNKSLLLIDGREVVIEFIGVVLWQALPIHLEDIERIEVIRGPGSALYGANAHSMVVSVITRKNAGGGAEAFLGNGEHDRSSLHLRLDLPLGDWRLHLSGGLDTQGHWRIPKNRQRTINRVNLSLEHESESSKTVLQVGLTNPTGVVYTQLAPAEGSNCYIPYLFLFHRTDLLRAQLSWKWTRSDWHLDVPLYWGETKLGEWPDVFTIDSSDLDADVQFTWSPFQGNLLIAGGNYRWNLLLAEDMAPQTKHEHRVGFFIHDEQRLFETLLITAGIRLDLNTVTPYAISPRLAGTWKFAENQFLRLAVGQAFRKPSYYESSLHFTAVEGTSAFPNLDEFFKKNIGNGDLGNEKTTTVEAGHRLRLFDKRLTLETDIFYTQYRNTISFWLDFREDEFGLPDLANSEMKFQNTGREADSVGGSVSLTLRLEEWRFGANYTFRHSWYTSEPSGAASVEGSKGERIPWEPAHLVNLSFQRTPEKGLRLGMALHGHSSCALAWQEDGSLFGDNIMTPSPGAYFISGFLAWRLDGGKWWAEMGVRAFNILNAGFRDLPAVRRPDGVELGGELLSQRIFFFLRGSI
jgi:iron complex outermembrane receptor protein